MKKYLYFSFLVFINVLSAQEKVENLDGFTEVKVFDRIRVTLIQDDENKIYLKGKNTQDIQLINQEGVLKIRMDWEKSFEGEETFVELHFTHLQVIDANEGAEIKISQLLEQDELEIRAQEGAQVTAGLNVKRLVLKAVTGGIITTRGSAGSQQVEINTGGVYLGKEFETLDTQIRIQAGGEADIFAKRTADIKLRAGGDVYVYGNPTELIKDTFIGGRVHEMQR